MIVDLSRLIVTRRAVQISPISTTADAMMRMGAISMAAILACVPRLCRRFVRKAGAAHFAGPTAGRLDGS